MYIHRIKDSYLDIQSDDDNGDDMLWTVIKASVFPVLSYHDEVITNYKN